MGNYIGGHLTGRVSDPDTAIQTDPRSIDRQTRKRRITDKSDNEVEDVSPKRKRLHSTSSYIYHTLYEQGTGSDIIITALDKKWNLHKIYLCQAGYFASMFSGRWKESSQPVVALDIPDPNITVQGLNLVFGSLYKDDVVLDKTQILSTVAIATMLQMDSLLQICEDFMNETLSSDTVIQYLTTANLYSLNVIRKECLSWLHIHFLTSYTVSLLRQISLEMMIELIQSTELYIMQVEMDLYTLTKKWLFLKLHDTWDDSLTKLSSTTEEYFKSLYESTAIPFLDTEGGVVYIPVFRSLRLQNILTDCASVNILESDGIVPQKWLLPLYREHWLKMVLVEQRLDSGPNIQSDEEFGRQAVRCGRVLTTPNEYCWRWTGYSFGVDILLIYSNGHISVKRNTNSQSCVASVSLHTCRQLMLRLRVVSFKESSESEISSIQDTGIVRLSLGQDEGIHIMTLDNDSQFPLYISFYFSLVSSNETPPTID